jgi:23S rRNA (cytidine1920-2'-O)/16S rRNA (cytidine1409-2'-O)-methyltransferase
MRAARVPLIERLKILFPDRDEKALFADILAGGVSLAGRTLTKPGLPVAADAAVEVRARPPYVSRGGEKLAAALDRWSIDCAGKVWVDAGCSTGGFTDCLLQRGAAVVHAVDVGENVLDWKLATDARVRARQGCNIMTVQAGALEPAPDAAVADLSFRSLRRAAAHILSLTREGWGIFLVKPQFEYREPPPDFHGVVSDPAAVRAILEEVVASLAAEGVRVEKAMRSPITGRRGNREYLFLLSRGAGDAAAPDLAALLGE